MVGESVDLDSPFVDHSVPEEHHDYTAHVLLISLDSRESENDPPIPADSKSPSSILVEHGGNHTMTPPSSLIISFD